MNKQIKFLTLASILTALSIALDLLVKNVLPVADFGLPYYAIPLIIGSIVLGPYYGAMMGFTSDFIGFSLMPRGTYAILFGLSAIAWGLLPGIFLKRDSKPLKVLITLLVTHMVVSSLNTLALYIQVSPTVAWGSLSLRLPMLPVNVLILSAITILLNKRLSPVYEDYLA